MQRIIDGFLYESKTLPNSWDVRTFEVNGHREISARKAVQWVEVGEAQRDCSRDGWGFNGEATREQLAKWAKQDADEAEERRQNGLKRSATRAKTMCRRIIKAEGFNELLTLTYRHNQCDRELA